MKSLRLHKYTERLIGLSQEQLLNLGDQELLQMGFTDGAKGKFIKQIKLVKERPELIKQFRKSLEVIEINSLLLSQVWEAKSEIVLGQMFAFSYLAYIGKPSVKILTLIDFKTSIFSGGK